MKKILIIILFLLSLGFTFADFKSDIRQSYEYIDFTGTEIFYNHQYLSNQNKSYFVLGPMMGYEVKDSKVLDRLNQKYTKSDLIFFFKPDTLIAFPKSDNRIKPQECQQIDVDQKVLIDSYPDKLVLGSDDSLLGKTNTTLNCLAYQNNIYLGSYPSSYVDMIFLKDNFLALTKEISGIKIENFGLDASLNKLKSLYKYVLTKTDYNFDVLQNPKNYDLGNDYPRRLDGFWGGKKIVCGSYALTFDLLSNLYGFNGEVQLGDVQKLDKDRVGLAEFGHAWVKVGNLYFDPTFDDSEGKVEYDYFAKPQKCFNLDHYMTGWTSFATTQDRLDYIKNNAVFLINSCPDIVKSVILADNTSIDFMKFAVQDLDLSTANKVFCDIFGMCINADTKTSLVDKLSGYDYVIGEGSSKQIYSLSDTLSNLTIKDVASSQYKGYAFQYSKKLDMNNKIKLNKVLVSLKTKVSKNGEDKMKTYFTNLGKKLDVFGQRNLSDDVRLKVNYINNFIKDILN